MVENNSSLPPHPEDSPQWSQQTHYPQQPRGVPSTIADPHRSSARPGPIPFEKPFSIAFKAFAANWGRWVCVALLYLLINLPVQIYAQVRVFMELGSASDPAELDSMWKIYGEPTFITIFLVTVVLQMVYNSLFILAVHRDLGGRPFTSFGQFFQTKGFLPVFLTGIATQLLVIVPFVLVVLKPTALWVTVAIVLMIVVSIFLYLAQTAAGAEDIGVGAALRASVNAVKSNFLMVVAIMVCTTVMSMLLAMTIVGIVVAIPVSIFIVAAVYRIAVGAPLQTAYL